MNWFNPKGWLLKIGLALGSRALEKERPILKEHVHSLIQSQGVSAVDRAIDSLQARIKALIQGLPLIPPFAKDELCAFIQKEGDIAQAKLDAAIVDGGPVAADKVLDSLFDTISNKLKSITL